MATAQERLTAHQAAFEKVLAAVTELEQTLGLTPREVRATGLLGEAVATITSAAHDGLRVIARG